MVVVGFRAEPGLERPGQIMVSGDGETFSLPEPVADEWLTEVTSAGDRFLAIGLSGGLWESDATGTRWESRALHSGWLDAISAPDAVPGLLLASGLGSYWKSIDAGGTWSRAETPGLYFEDFAFLDGVTGVGVEGTLVPASGTIWWTPDGGTSWSARVTARSAVRTVAIAETDAREIWAAGDGGVVMVTTDGGLSWRDQSGPMRWDEGAADLTDLDFAGDGEGWLVGTRGEARSYRGRDLAEPLRWTNGDAGGSYVLQGVFAISREEAYVTGYRSFTDRGVVLRTKDGGRTWRVLAETPGVFWYSIAGRRS